jgi:hypothetical protein
VNSAFAANFCAGIWRVPRSPICLRTRNLRTRSQTRSRRRPRSLGALDRQLQSTGPPLGARLSHPCGFRGNLHRNGRSAAQTRRPRPIARCSVGAPAPISSRESNCGWMNVGDRRQNHARLNHALIPRSSWYVEGSHCIARDGFNGEEASIMNSSLRIASFCLFMIALVPTIIAGEISVAIFFVDLTGVASPEPKYLACGDSSRAGPFMSAGTAIEWRGEFLDPSVQSPDRIIGAWNTDPGVCSTGAWFHDGSWHQ